MSDLDACLLAPFPGTRPPDWLRQWLDDGLGGVLLFASNITSPGQLRDLTSQLREHNPDVLIAVDEEGGIVTRVEARTGSSYPGNAALGAAGDPGLTRRVAAAMGAMLAGGGINLDLAPSADLDINPANPVIGVRSFGADPDCVAEHTAEFVRGIQSHRVAACVKHFPGHGRTDADSHLTLPAVEAWARPGPVAESGHAAGPRLGAEAARRGLFVATAKLPLGGAPYLLDAGGRMSSLLDDTAASLLGVLRSRRPAIAGVRLAEPPAGAGSHAVATGPDGPAGLDTLIGPAAGRPLVLAVADAHRRPWQAELVRSVLARRPDTVVVGTGTVHDAPLADGSYLGTRGEGRANLEAAADLLLGREPAR